MVRDMLIQNMDIWGILDFGVTIRVARDIPFLGDSSWSVSESSDEHTRAKRLKDFPRPMSLRVSVAFIKNIRETNVSKYPAVHGCWAALACPRNFMTVSI